MARRTRKPYHDEITREKIKTSQLINRLMDHIFKGLELSATQIRSIEILLKKSLPDLQAIEMTGELNHTHENLDLSALDKSELEALERTLAKASQPTGSESRDSASKPDTLH